MAIFEGLRGNIKFGIYNHCTNRRKTSEDVQDPQECGLRVVVEAGDAVHDLIVEGLLLGFLLGEGVFAGDEIVHAALQDIGDPHKCGKRRVGVPALDVADMRGVDVEAVRDVFLRDADGLPALPDFLSDGLEI